MKHFSITRCADRRPLARQFVAWLIVVSFVTQPTVSFVNANPQNPEVRHGAAEFNFDTPGELLIDQLSDRAVIDWESFSIDAGELTRFVQPNSRSAALSRVFSGSPSEIHGRLQANGQIFLINPNGILVGPGGAIDTAGFLGSTLDVSDAEFMTGGDMTFNGGSNASVINLGTINAIDGGDIFLIARNVENGGTLNASEGVVGLAAGSEVRVAAAGDERISIAPGGEGSVTNSGTVSAITAELKAAGGNQFSLAINNEGLVKATGFEARAGRLYLSGGGGRIVNTGRLEASHSVSVINPGGSVESAGTVRSVDDETGNGGAVTIAASEVRLLPGSTVDVSGAEAGAVDIAATGLAQIDGGVRANGEVGNGGIVRVTGAEIALGATGDIRADGAADGGLVTLGVDPRSGIGHNSDGSLATSATKVALAAGSNISANGAADLGGKVLLFGSSDGEMRLGGQIKASGGGAGGEIFALGGDVFVEQTALLKANGETNGGLIRMEGSGDVHVAGQMQARGATGDGGFIHVTGENVSFTETGVADARGGRDGGMVQLEGGEDGTVSIAGQLLASGGRDGGMIQIGGGDIAVTQTGLLDASGDVNGGFISIEAANSADFNGTALAMGGSGDGGMIAITGENVTVGATGLLDASGGTNGGLITAEAENNVNFNGTARALGGSGDGGQINVTGENVSLSSTALLDASGAVMGGNINIGGGRGGRDANLKNARSTTVANGARIVANGAQQGGNVVLWANGTTDFQGSIENTGATAAAGGFAEVSGLEHLNFAGAVNTGGGQLLLDPFNYVIGAAQAANIVAALGSNNVTIDTSLDDGANDFGSSGNSGDVGNLNVNSAISYDSAFNLAFNVANDATFSAQVVNAGAGNISVDAVRDVFINANITTNGAGSVDVDAGRSIKVGSAAIVSTVDGGITFNANSAGTTTGNFKGVEINNATIRSSGVGAVDVNGRGGDTGANNYGIYLLVGGIIESTGIGADAATLSVNGNGGAGTAANHGIFVTDTGSKITSVDGAVDVTGTGGAGSGAANNGLYLVSGGLIESTGMGADAATLSVTGTGGADTGGGQASGAGILVSATGSKITSVDGAVNVTATGSNGSGWGVSHGLHLVSGGMIESTGTGADAATLSVNGTGTAAGTSGHGIYVQTTGSKITSVDGKVNVTGTTGAAGNYGVFLNGGGIESTGTGADAATLTINGTGGDGTSGNIGIYVQSTGSKITSVDGAVNVTGRGRAGTSGNIGLTLNAGGMIESTGTGANAATLTINGTGGDGTSGNIGIYVNGTGSKITSVDGAVNVTGRGGAGTSGNIGLTLNAGGMIESTGTGANAATLTINGTGGDGTSGNRGTDLHGTGSRITSVDGAVNVTGIGGTGTASGNVGLTLNAGGMIESTGTGANAATLTINGTGGDGTSGNRGTDLHGTGSRITSVDGAVNVTGRGGAGTSGNIGLTLNAGGMIESTGTGANAATLTINGTGGDGTSGNIGIWVRAAGSKIASVDGAVNVTGIGGTGTASGNDGLQLESGSVGSSGGNTFVGVGGDLVADAASVFTSAPAAAGGQLRIYLAGNDNVNTAATMNGTAHGATPFPNNQGVHTFGTGPYAPAVGNFAYYTLAATSYNYVVGAAEATAITDALNGGADVTLQRDLNQGGFGAQPVYFATDREFITVNADIFYESQNAFNLIAPGDISFNANVQNRNATGGAINVVAGWDGTTAFNAGAFLAEDVTSTTVYGQNMGSVNIGNGTQATGVAVGARSGDTNVFGYDVNLRAGNSADAGRFAQLGFQVSDGIALGGFDLDPDNPDGQNVALTGAINIRAINDIEATAGAGQYNYAQIGHVGADQTPDAAIDAVANSAIGIAAGHDLNFSGGDGNTAYTLLGHGGYQAEGDFSGNISVAAANVPPTVREPVIPNPSAAPLLTVLQTVPGVRFRIDPPVEVGRNPVLVISTPAPLPPEIVQQLTSNPFFEVALIEGVSDLLGDPFQLPEFSPPGEGQAPGNVQLLPDSEGGFTLGSGEVEEDEE